MSKVQSIGFKKNISSKTKLSVIIASYNRCESLKGTLDSLLSQECNGRFDYEVIIVDNNSLDKTKEVVESYITKFNGRIRYLFEPCQGQSAALNRGINDSKADIIALTDDDVIVSNNWLNTISSIFKNNPDVECVTGKVIPIWHTEKPEWYSNKIKSVIVDVEYGEEKKEVKNAVGANSVYRRTIFEKYGKFDDTSILIDVTFSSKIREHGVKVIYFPELLVCHPVQAYRNNKAYFKKWFSDKGKVYADYFKKSKEKTFLRVEPWVYRKLLAHSCGYLMNITNLRERFYHYLNLLYYSSFFKQRIFKNGIF